MARKGHCYSISSVLTHYRGLSNERVTKPSSEHPFSPRLDPLPILTAGMKGTHSLLCSSIDLALTDGLGTALGIKL